MNEIIVKPKNKKESIELQSFFKNHKINFDIINEDLEDDALLAAMEEVKNLPAQPIEQLYKEMGWK